MPTPLEIDHTIKRRITTSFITTVVSVSLVLFLLGLVGMLLLNNRKLANYVRENIGISIYFNEEVREVDIFSLQKSLDANECVKETRYITREEAAKIFIQELGEDFVSFLGENPLPASIDVKLVASYANADSMAKLEKTFRAYPNVADVAYQKDLVFAVNQNIKKISLAILVFGILLFLITITLINNTIRLTVYAKRFLIRTMQLVGAHNHFIRKPFLIKGISQGVLSACLAMILILGVIFLTENQLEGLYSFFDIRILALVYLLILISGILITWISTLLSVNKYLKIKTDHLYT